MKDLFRKLEPVFFKIKKIWLRIITAFKASTDHRPVVLAIGDSWFNLTLINIDAVFGPVDTLDYLSQELNLVDAAIPGYQLAKEMDNRLYEPVLKSIPDKQNNVLVLLSLIGNDLVWKHFKNLFVVENEEHKVDKNYVTEVVLELLADLDVYIELMRDNFASRNKEIKVVINGYDYVRTETETLWFDGALTPKFKSIGVEDEQKANDLMNGVVDILNDLMKIWSELRENVVYCDLRGTLQIEDYFEDFHPNSVGYAKIASKILETIKSRLDTKYYS